MEETCNLCGRTVPASCMESHHLVPKHKGGKGMGTIRVCVDCGNQLHLLFSNNELRDRLNTLESLLADERVQRWVQWVRRRREFGVCAKEKKRK